MEFAALLKLVEQLPLGDLMALAEHVAKMIDTKSTPDAVKAGETAADVAADVAEAKKFPEGA